MKTSPAAEKLSARIRAGDLAGVVDLVLRWSAPERTALGPLALAEMRARRFRRTADGKMATADGGKWDRARFDASRLAVVACSSWTKLQKLNWNDHDSFAQAHEWTEWWRQLQRVFEALRPDWLDAWAQLALQQNRDHWFFVRALIRQKLCRAPVTEAYTLGMLSALRWRFHTYVKKKGGGRESKFPTIAAALLDDPDLLREDVWRIFEVEGNSDCNLQSLEPTQSTNWRENTKIPADVEESSWRHALVELAAAGRLPRARLLEASLAAVARDFAPHRAGWYFRLHDALAPTPAERARLRDRYLRFLASPNPNVVAWALQTVSDLDQAEPLPPAALVENLAPALSAKAKTSVKAALQLLRRAIERAPEDQRGALLLLATTALVLEAADTQRLVLALLRQHAKGRDAALAQSLRTRAPHIVPSLRAEFATWLPTEAASVSQPAMVPSTPRSFSPLDESRRIPPITTLDELLDRAAYAVAHPEDCTEVERVLDGIARLGPARPADLDARAGPLRQVLFSAIWPHLRRRQAEFSAAALLREGHCEYLVSVPHLLGYVVLSWLDGKPAYPRFRAAGLDSANQVFRFLFHRLRTLSQRIAQGGAVPLLSAPTHRGGWIDPAALVRRMIAWQQAGQAVEPHDFCLALLRLAPERRAEALPLAASLAGEAAAALRYALGADAVAPGRTAALWIAAARARAPFLDDAAVEQAFPGRGPDAGNAARLLWLTERTTAHYKHPMERAVAEMLQLQPSSKRAFALDELVLTVGPVMPEAIGHAPLPVLLHGPWEGDGFHYRQETDLLRWAFTLWPASREPILGSLALWLMSTTQSFTYRATYRHGFMQVAFEALADPFTRPGPMSTLLHALALLSPEAECRGLGVDALAALVETNRFSPAALGTTLARLLPTTLFKATRLAPALGEAARISAAHRAAVIATIEQMLAGDPGKAPRDLAAVLDLLLELLTAAGRQLAEADARSYLAGLVTGRAASLAKKILAR